MMDDIVIGSPFVGARHEHMVCVKLSKSHARCGKLSKSKAWKPMVGLVEIAGQ
jgi:hypothetical protein